MSLNSQTPTSKTSPSHRDSISIQEAATATNPGSLSAAKEAATATNPGSLAAAKEAATATNPGSLAAAKEAATATNPAKEAAANPEGWISVKAAAALLSIPVNTCYVMCLSRTIPSYKFGKLRRLLPSDIVAYMERHRVEAIIGQ